MKRIITTVFLIALLYGCAATVGKDFVHPDSTMFTLGQTTYSQAVTQLGEPRSVGDVMKNGKTMKHIIYNYGSTKDEPFEEGVLPVRQIVYIFYNDTLVSQAFLSSFKSDSPDFDEKKIDGITKGKTGRSDVIQLMGRPTSSSIPPMVADPSVGAVGYGYITTRRGEQPGSFKHTMKILIISFDDRDVVSNIEYEASGSK